MRKSDMNEKEKKDSKSNIEFTIILLTSLF